MIALISSALNDHMTPADNEHKASEPEQAPTNDAARQLWAQMFANMAKDEKAAIQDPDHDDAADIARLRHALADAGWTDLEVQRRIELLHTQISVAPQTSPGVHPHVEYIFKLLCDDIESAMDRLGMESHKRVTPRARFVRCGSWGSPPGARFDVSGFATGSMGCRGPNRTSGRSGAPKAPSCSSSDLQ